jgi:hypothetical protein
VKSFETRFLEEADQFIATLDKKSARKVFYNIDLPHYLFCFKGIGEPHSSVWLNKPTTQNFSRSYKVKFGSLEADIWEIKTDFWHFGTKQNLPKFWFWQHTDL